MDTLLVSITEILDYSFYPGICQAVLTDLSGKWYTFTDKIPVFTDADVTPSSPLPVPGVIRCEVVDTGPGWARVSTLRPDAVESDEGLTEFLVSPDQINKA